jgi:hypothetical protein
MATVSATTASVLMQMKVRTRKSQRKINHDCHAHYSPTGQREIEILPVHYSLSDSDVTQALSCLTEISMIYFLVPYTFFLKKTVTGPAVRLAW